MTVLGMDTFGLGSVPIEVRDQCGVADGSLAPSRNDCRGCWASLPLGPTDREGFPDSTDANILNRVATDGSELRKGEPGRYACIRPPDAVQSEKTSSRNPCISVQDRTSALGS